jgi:Flp pilus assembly protein TadD
MDETRLRALVTSLRHDEEAANQAGRRYEQGGDIPAARDCYGQAYGIEHGADKLEALLSEGRTHDF